MQPKKVLIIDDMVDLAETLKDLVTFKGYHGISATNGTEGIEVALREHPDLILLDIRMPDIDGFEVMRRLRQDPWGKDANIVFLTASTSIDEVPADLSINPEDFLTKAQWGVENIAAKIKEKIGT